MHVLIFYALSSSTLLHLFAPNTLSEIVSMFIFPSFFSCHPLFHQPSELDLMRMTQKSEQTGIPFDSLSLRFLVVTGLRSSLLIFFSSQSIMKLFFSLLWNIASPPCCRPKAPPPNANAQNSQPPAPLHPSSSSHQCRLLFFNVNLSLFFSQALPQPSPLLLGTIP